MIILDHDLSLVIEYWTDHPIVAVDGDAWFVELHVFVDVSGVAATTLDHEGDGAPHIDLRVASLGGDPVRGVLTANHSLHDRAFWLKAFGDHIHVTSPCTLGPTVQA